MPRGDRNERPTPLVATGFCALALIGVSLLIFFLGALSGEQQNRADTAYRYQESAKESAQRACVGADPSRVFECVIEKVETAQAAAQSEQDLAAQQQAAWAGMLSSVWSLGALAATILGLYWIKGTLDASRASISETRRIGEAQTRAYLSVVRADFVFNSIDLRQMGRPLFETKLHLSNSGQTPAVNVSYCCEAQIRIWKERDSIPPFKGYKLQNFVNNVAANVERPEKVIYHGIANIWLSYQEAWEAIGEDTVFGEFPMLVIYGTIFYDDVFEQTFKSDFAFLLEGVEPDANGNRKEDLSTVQSIIKKFAPVRDRQIYLAGE